MAVPKRKLQFQKNEKIHHKLSSSNVIEDKKVGNTDYLLILILNQVLQRQKDFRYLVINNDKKITIAIDAMGGENAPKKC